jgi:DNA-binding response OmpR family regulator
MARIIVIDDEPSVADLIGLALTGAGYAVELVQDGNDGVKRHRTESADLIITDIYMPKVDGVEIIREFRRDFPRLPIIVMSGSPLRDIMFTRAQELGVAGVLEKPFDLSVLLDTVRKALEEGPSE